MKTKFACVVLWLGAAAGSAAEPKTVRATILPPGNRKPAPEFSLRDASGKEAGLSGYRGNVMLLDFWATECGGCRVEIPWFVELDQGYKGRGLKVVGVSMDVMYEGLKSASEGWSRVKPFVRDRQINYQILMGDDRVAKMYNVQAMPATYLIDKIGRIAAVYAGIVDRNDVETHIKTLLAEH